MNQREHICFECKKVIETDSAMKNVSAFCSAKCVKDFFKNKTKSQKRDFIRSQMMSSQKE